MFAFITSQPWYLWLFLIVAILYIFLIYWFCTKHAPESYDGKNPKICLLITALTIAIIFGSILMIILAI